MELPGRPCRDEDEVSYAFIQPPVLRSGHLEFLFQGKIRIVTLLLSQNSGVEGSHTDHNVISALDNVKSPSINFPKPIDVFGGSTPNRVTVGPSSRFYAAIGVYDGDLRL